MHDGLVLPPLLVVAPVTSRFAFARDRLSRDAWEPAYRLSCGRLWWRSLRWAASRGELHPCAERLAKHVSWHLDDQVTLTDIRAVLERYAAYHDLSVRTAWTDWGRLVSAGWLTPTRAPTNQGHGHPQGPGTGRMARYVLTAPAAVVTQLQPRPRSSPMTALDTSSSLEEPPSPSVPPARHRPRRGWITLQAPTVAERREASALLAGCHPPWRRQRPDQDLLTRDDWQQLLPLVAQVHRQRPDLPLTALLTDRVRSARHLPNVLAWRLWRLLRTGRPQENHRQRPPSQATPPDQGGSTDDGHLATVRTLGGPAAARAALATAGRRSGSPARSVIPTTDGGTTAR